MYYLLAASSIADKTRSADYLNKAVSALQQAMKYAPTDPKIPYTLAAIIIDNKPQEAKQLLQLTLQLKPDYTPASELLIKQFPGK